MDYRPSWNLSSIPDNVLFSEVGKRRVSQRPLKEVPAERRDYLDRNREAVRKYRAKVRQQELEKTA